jgi:D-alanyl-D-alanine carboxypeptidase/D-alanyl-D-alanine-endopeptidase (penicillin-binding protein 4)
MMIMMAQLNKLKTRLVCLLVMLTLNSGAFVRGQVPQPTQTQQRERRVVTPAPTPPPTLAPAPTPTPAPSRAPQTDTIVGGAAATTAAKPASAAVRNAPSSSAPKTVRELQERISEILGRPELAPAMVAVKVASLDTGRTLFEENADKLLRPASNMKLYTLATALDRLSPDYHFRTSIYADAPPDLTGNVRGDLIVYGRGDPSIAARFNNGDYNQGIDELAKRIQAAGVKRIEGDLVGDETYFIGPPLGTGWEWEDLTWYYGAEVTALTVNDNALDLFVKPGASLGAPCVITTGPATALVKIVNRTTTAARGTQRDLRVYRGLGANVLEVSGQLAQDDKGYSGGVGLTHPATLFLDMLRQSLVRRGVTINGRARTIEASASGPITASPATRVEIASLLSPPFSLIAAQTLKPSQNLYTELILRTLGKTSAPVSPVSPPSISGPTLPPPSAPQTSEEAGLEVVRKFLTEAGVNPNELVLTDGSGLSRNDLVTASATLQLLTYMSRHRYGAAFRDALPIAGVDGTLRNRFRGTQAENNMHAKTGSLSSAASLSGYVTSASGERLVFSIMVNNYPASLDARRDCIDPIAVLLASLAGRS